MLKSNKPVDKEIEQWLKEENYDTVPVAELLYIVATLHEAGDTRRASALYRVLESRREEWPKE